MESINWELLITVGLAYLGFIQWRSELIGRKRADIAEKAIILSTKAKHVISYARSPISYSGEGRTRPLGAGETDGSRNSYKDSIFTKVERINENADIFKELSEISYLFHAYFGDKAQKHFHSIIVAQRTVVSSAYSLIRLKDEPKNRKLMDKYENHIYEGEENDEITKQVDEAVDGIEKICAPIIRGIYSPKFLKTKKCLSELKRWFFKKWSNQNA